jgi:hypothetical protein
MATKRAKLLAISIGAAAFVLAPAAFAQDAKGGGDKADGYGYEFSDDPLNAGGFIRPRTTFVPEMLKSVENI